MVSPDTKDEVVRSVLSREENQSCFDCRAAGPKWASVTYGILLCDTCAEEHRSLGIALSFVRGLQEDGWTVKQLKSLAEGGNKAFEDFLHQYKIARNAPVDFKYRTKAAEFYRAWMKKLAAGDRPDTEPPELMLGLTLMSEEDVSVVPAPPVSVEPGLIDSVTGYLGSAWVSVETKVGSVYESANELTKRPTIKKVEEKALSTLFSAETYINSWFQKTPSPSVDPRQLP